MTTLEDEVVTSVACGSHFTAAITNQRLPEGEATTSPPEVPATGLLWVWGHNQVLLHPQYIIPQWSHRWQRVEEPIINKEMSE